MTTLYPSDFHVRLDGLVRRVKVVRERPYEIEVGQDDMGVFIQVICWRPDTFTGEYGHGRGGPRYLHPAQTDSSIFRSILAALLDYESHEVREAYTIDGKRPYGPHLSIDALLEIADRIE